MPLLLHPDAFLERKLVFPDGHELYLPPPDRRLLSQEGIEFIEERGPSYLLGSNLLVTGQIHRTTPFEQGFPIHYASVAEQWQHDPLIHDDQAVVMNVKAKGLVILTGCGGNQYRSPRPGADWNPEGVCPDRRISSHRGGL